MEERKNLCAQIPISLHNKVRQEQQKSGKSLSDYITEVLTEYYEGGRITMAATRTLAIQISEELFQKLKTYLAEESQRRGRKISQKEFIIELIEEAIEGVPDYQRGISATIFVEENLIEEQPDQSAPQCVISTHTGGFLYS